MDDGLLSRVIGMVFAVAFKMAWFMRQSIV